MALERIGHNQRCPQNNHTEAQNHAPAHSLRAARYRRGHTSGCCPGRQPGAGGSGRSADAGRAGPTRRRSDRRKHSPVERAEAHIKSLHDKLKITPAQEPQWGAVAQAMRDSAQKMEVAIQQRQEAATLTAIDDLKAYQAIADAHSQGLQELIPAFQALYASMSDEQKKNADTIFSQSREHRHRASK
jgi:hypothetical protein